MLFQRRKENRFLLCVYVERYAFQLHCIRTHNRIKSINVLCERWQCDDFSLCAALIYGFDWFPSTDTFCIKNCLFFFANLLYTVEWTWTNQWFDVSKIPSNRTWFNVFELRTKKILILISVYFFLFLLVNIDLIQFDCSALCGHFIHWKQAFWLPARQYFSALVYESTCMPFRIQE